MKFNRSSAEKRKGIPKEFYKISNILCELCTSAVKNFDCFSLRSLIIS